MCLLTASHRYTQTTLSNDNASVLTTLCLVQFLNTAKIKEEEMCTNAECSRADVADCFPCTNAAQSLLFVLSMSGKL